MAGKRPDANGVGGKRDQGTGKAPRPGGGAVPKERQRGTGKPAVAISDGTTPGVSEAGTGPGNQGHGQGQRR